MITWLTDTMLIERFMGVFIYSVSLVFVFCLLKRTEGSDGINKILNIYLFFLTVMGFFYIPSQSADLFRWYEIMGELTEMPFIQFFITDAVKRPTPVAYIIMYVCCASGIKGILPAFCSLVFHYNIFSVLKQLNRDLKYSNEEIAYALLLVMSVGRFLEAISGVRCLVAISILANCFCKEFLNDEPLTAFVKNIPFALIASLMHLLAFSLYAFRILFMAFQWKNGKRYKKSINITIIAVTFLGCILGQKYIKLVFEKAISYLTGEKYFYIWEYIIAILMFCILVYILYMVYQINQRNKLTEYNTIIKFNFFIMIIELLICFQYSMFHRMVTFSSIMMIPLVAYYLKYSTDKKRCRMVLCFSFILMFLACARGDLCAYKFFLINW